MSEIIDSLLEKYKTLLSKEESVSQELIDSLEAELAKDQPNPEKLAELIKKPKRAEP